MKSWQRITLVISALMGSTAFFGHWSISQFDNAFDNLSASFVAVNTQSVSSSLKKDAHLASTSPEISGELATTTDLKFSFIFPEKDGEVYMGCMYQLLFQSSTTIRSLETALIDADATKTIEPIISGLAKKNKIEPNSQSLDWKVGVVLPGDYYIKVSNINGVNLENYSKVFTIRKMPKGIKVDEREKKCKKSKGSLPPFIQLHR